VVIVGKAIVEGIQIRNNATVVTQVSQRQIKDLNAMDLPSALRRVPGVMISRHNFVGSYGGGEGGSIYIRGMGSARPGASIQTLVDGVPKFVGVWSHPLMDVLGTEHLEQIDVYKSPQPVRWGNMSLGAVNLISRRMRREGTTTEITALGGQLDTYGFVFNHGGKFGDFDYYFGGAVKGSDGHRPRADGQLRNYWGRVGYRLKPNWDVSLILSGSDNWADDPGPVGAPPPKRARFNTDDFTLNLTLTNRSQKTNGFIRLYVDDGAINWEQWSNKTGNWFNSKTDYLNRGLRIQQNFLFSGGSRLTLGLDYDSYGGVFTEEHADPANTKHMPEKYFFNTAPYASLSHSFSLGSGIVLTPSAGLRFNHHTAFDNELAPEAGLILSGDGWDLYANYAWGFNYTGIYSVWFYNVAWGYQQEAYKNLKPERVNHFEVGLKLTPVEKMSLDMSIFHDRGKNMVRFIPPPPPPPSFANVDEFKTTGFEFSANWAPSGELSLFAGLSLLSKDPETLPQAPGYTFSLGANLKFLRKFQLSLDLEAVDEKFVTNPRFAPLSTLEASGIPRTDSYAVANAKLSYYLETSSSSLKRGSHIFVAVENFTDTQYEYKPGYPMPGATAFLGMSLEY